MIETNLDLVLVLLGFALVAAVFFRLVSMPLLIGYLFVGIILGPSLFDLIKEKTGVAHLAEFGIVFLMFSIGLEFNLSKLASIWRTVIQWGGLQLILSALLFAVFSYMDLNLYPFEMYSLCHPRLYSLLQWKIDRLFDQKHGVGFKTH